VHWPIRSRSPETTLGPTQWKQALPRRDRRLGSAHALIVNGVLVAEAASEIRVLLGHTRRALVRPRTHSVAVYLDDDDRLSARRTRLVTDEARSCHALSMPELPAKVVASTFKGRSLIALRAAKRRERSVRDLPEAGCAGVDELSPGLLDVVGVE
jgi:hypothetical protein